MTPYLIISLIILILILGLFIIWLYRTKGLKEAKMDYRTLFILGIVWLPLGIATDNKAFLVVSLILLVLSLANRKEWNKNDRSWKDLSLKQKNIKLVIVGVLFLILIIGVVFFFLAERGMLI